jgi:hypothetical protein
VSAILLGILATVIADQLCATFPSLALKAARWSAARRYAGNPAKAELRAEELEALIEQRPGGLLKLGTGLGLAIAALATASRRALGKNPVITIARATGRAIVMGAAVIAAAAVAIWYLYISLCILVGGALMFAAVAGLTVGAIAGTIDKSLGAYLGLSAAAAVAIWWAITWCRACVAILREELGEPKANAGSAAPET